MSESTSDSSRSSSPARLETPSKHRKLIKSSSFNTSNNNSVLEDDWKCRRMRRSLTTLLNNLCQTEATLNPRTSAEVLPEEGKNVLEVQLQLNKDILQELQEDLETLITRSNDARAAQAAAEGELSQLKTTMAEHIGEAVAFLQEETSRQKELFEEKTSSLEKELVHMEWLRQQVVLLEERRRESSSNVRNSKSVKPGGTLVVPEGEYYDLLQENETLKFQLEVLKEERDKRATVISKNVEGSSSDEEGSSEDNDEPYEIVEKENEKQDRRVWLGKCYGLVSDRKYFEIDWKKEYEALPHEMSRCKKCPSYRAKRHSMKEHIWSKHYKGKFCCAYCKDDVGYSWKNGLRRHVLKVHPNVHGVKDK